MKARIPVSIDDKTIQSLKEKTALEQCSKRDIRCRLKRLIKKKILRLYFNRKKIG